MPERRNPTRQAVFRDCRPVSCRRRAAASPCVIPVVADPDPHDHTAAQQRYFTLADTRCPRRTRSGKTDPPHRRITVPQAFWKIVVRASDTDGALRASGFLADQNEALDAVEVMLPAPEAAPVRWESW